MNTPSTAIRKPYTTPRVQEQGRVAQVTLQGPTPTPIVGSLVPSEFDEF